MHVQRRDKLKTIKHILVILVWVSTLDMLESVAISAPEFARPMAEPEPEDQGFEIVDAAPYVAERVVEEAAAASAAAGAYASPAASVGYRRGDAVARAAAVAGRPLAPPQTIVQQRSSCARELGSADAALVAAARAGRPVFQRRSVPPGEVRPTVHFYAILLAPERGIEVPCWTASQQSYREFVAPAGEEPTAYGKIFLGAASAGASRPVESFPATGQVRGLQTPSNFHDG